LSNNYPAWRFSAQGQSVVVLSPEEDAMLGKDWSEKVPADFEPAKHPTYRDVGLVEQPVDVEAIAEGVADAPVRRKPGPKPKAA
jgi:hypothetical protein